MEAINSIIGNFKERVTNPFFATLIGVWLVRNWELVYTIFNFDDDCDLLYKTEFIRTYFNGINIWLEGWRNVRNAFVVMIIGYAILLISKTIVYFVQYRIIPHIKKFASSKLVITKTTYDAVRKSRDEYAQEILNQREITNNLDQKNSDLKNENDSLKSTIVSKETELVNLEGLKNDSDTANASLNLKISSLNGIIKNLEERLQSSDIAINLLNNQIVGLDNDYNKFIDLLFEEFREYDLFVEEGKMIAEDSIPPFIDNVFRNMLESEVDTVFFSVLDDIGASNFNENYIQRLIDLNLFFVVDESKSIKKSSNLGITGLGRAVEKFKELLINKHIRR